MSGPEGGEEAPVLTLGDLDALARSADPVPPAADADARQLGRRARFERAAAPYRALLESARRLLLAGRSIGPELELQLVQGARALERIRETLGAAASSP